MAMLYHLPVAGSSHLADTATITHYIKLSQRFYSDFENDSSLFYAARSLELSNRLLHDKEVVSDEKLIDRIRAFKALSYVAYARSIRGTDMQAAEDSLWAGFRLVEESGLISEKAAIYEGLGDLYDRKGQNEKAFQYYKTALELYQQSGRQDHYLDQLINLGLILRVMGNYGESLEYLMEALKTGRQVSDTSAVVESLLAMGFVYAFVEKWEDALRCQQEALGIYQQANDQWGIARIHNDMGVTYSLAGELDSALAQHQAALALRLKSNDAYNTFASFLYIGDIYADQGNYVKAVEFYEKAIPYGNNAGYKVTVVGAHLRLASYYLILTDEEKSLANFRIALQLSREIGDPTGQSRAATGLAGISLARNDRKSAIAMLKTAEKTAPASNIHDRMDTYRKIAEAYFKLGDAESAYLNSLIYSELKDSVSAAENLEKITRLTNVMAFENEMALQKESNEKMIAIKQAQINRERVTRNIFLSGMILAVVLVVIIFVRFIEKKKLSHMLNETLSNLRATQRQLVHAEKMASLGELTAGIAHEIQNPLNFVNNFSEVSIEMIDEMKQESSVVSHQSSVVSHQSSVVSHQSLLEIVDDVRQNLEKIHHHGKRADAIVKGMLQHSRTNTGQKDLADINALADEYLRLAYHGLRAKDKTFNANFHTEFDPALPKIEVIPQDIGRVLLNLINNAFYAVSARKLSESNLSGSENLTGLTYEPTVTVSTKNLGSHIEIRVKDNGDGIPDNIRDKIFQPFFSTKPTGEGTGLGLSLSYDIITKGHGGELKVESKEGEGAEFIIRLNPTSPLPALSLGADDFLTKPVDSIDLKQKNRNLL
jgi:signal transduction histidine kinase/Tfp pilus assembly protein PilF